MPTRLIGTIPSTFVGLDLETTGLNSGSDRIIEFAAIKFTIGKQNHTSISSLVKPGVPIPRRITTLTGITDKMVEQDGVEIGPAMRDLKEFIGNHMIVAFNAKFDIPFLNSEFSRNGIGKIDNVVDCALLTARKAWPELDSHKLSYLSELLGFDVSGNHRALKDAGLAIKVYLYASCAIHERTKGR